MQKSKSKKLAAGAKPSNPKDALGIKKVPFTTVSAPVIAEVGLAMLEGALKYGKHNYRVIGVRSSVYVDATERHLKAYEEGEDLDPESKVGIHHITKAISSLCVLRDAQIQGKCLDDRPPASPKGWMEAINKKVEALLEAYPNPVAPFTEEGEKAKRKAPTKSKFARFFRGVKD